ncbi:hypothetical protein GGC63_003094 [Paenibacillus sp. OAS669]|nr:hypothetical protein [Paenibacillus sp. OAS669]
MGPLLFAKVNAYEVSFTFGETQLTLTKQVSSPTKLSNAYEVSFTFGETQLMLTK